MTPEQWEKIDRVWHAVLASPEPNRAAVLSDVCSGDERLRRDVESMLEHLARASDAGFGVTAGVLARVPLSPGTRLGPYTITNSIGAGGMGEVYRARDTRLARDVAIKVLPFEVAREPDRLRRFEQEARAAAALNHPNVLAVHDVGSERLSRPLPKRPQASGAASADTDVSFIVTELLEGRTLRQLLADEKLSIGRAIGLASQIADGLAAAHARGIVHRDLKPDNLFVTPDGRVKILDFGLAKAAAEAASLSETPTKLETAPHLVLGTPGYMAPEQARGQDADHRADIFAFGAVLFEMLTGRRAFDGDTVFDRMSAVLRDAPAATLSTPERPVPPPVVRIVERCLEKLPAARFQSTTDLAFALKGLSLLESSATRAVPARESRSAGSRWRVALPWAVAAGLAVALATVWRPQSAPAETPGASPTETPGAAPAETPAATPAKIPLIPRAERSRVVSFTIGEPEGAAFGAEPPLLPFAALSPDGQHVVFVATASGGSRKLFLRRMDETEAHALLGTESTEKDFGMQPFWSASGHSIGFVSNGMLKRIDVASGRVQSIYGELKGFAGGAWALDDTIVFAGSQAEGLARVSAKGGKQETLYEPNRTRRERMLGQPSFLPDGRHFTYMARPAGKIMVGSVDGATPKVLVDGNSAAHYDPTGGFLVYCRSTGDRICQVVAHRFDLETLSVKGEPLTVVDDVYLGIGGAAFTVSFDEPAMLVYRGGEARDGRRRLTLLNHSGERLDSAREAVYLNGFDLFPDGRRVLLARPEGLQENLDLHMFDFDSGTDTRVTFDPAWDGNAIISSDGNMFMWLRSLPSGDTVLYRMATNGAGGEIPVGKLPGNVTRLTHWFEQRVVATVTGQDGSSDIWFFNADDPGSAKPYRATIADEERGRLSPDGRFMAFNFVDSGQPQVHIRRFPDDGGVWTFSVPQGARFPHWRDDGRELYFKTNARMMAVNVDIRGTALSVSIPRVLFDLPDGVGFKQDFGVTPDGKKFLLAVPENGQRSDDSPRPLIVIENWRARLRGR